MSGGRRVAAPARSEQNPLLNRGALFVKTSGDTTPLIPTLEKLVASVDPDQPVFDVKTMEQRLDDSLGSRRFNAALIGTFAVIAHHCTWADILGKNVRRFLGHGDEVIGLLARDSVIKGIRCGNGSH